MRLFLVLLLSIGIHGNRHQVAGDSSYLNLREYKIHKRHREEVASSYMRDVMGL